MSKSVDQRVVSMEFDNSKFERNVQTSMKTLGELNKTLDNLPETSGKGFMQLSGAARNIDLSGVSNAIETINSRFSTMGIIGMTVISDLTKSALNMGKQVWNNTFGQIKSGGLARATNIEQAKFTLQGMGLDFSKVDKSINDAVTDTAYGYDAAAMAAAQLASSNVKLGDEMDKALKSISGVASMTNSSYEEIADIYTTAASLNKVTGDLWNRLAFRGLNGKAVLAEALGKTQEEITKMTQKGQIDFKTFSDAMWDAFADHASDANNTFQGVTANIRAALSKIGQSFYQPLIANESPLVMMLGEVKNRLNEVKKYIDPATKVVTDFILKISDAARVTMEGWNLQSVQVFFTNVSHILRNLIKAFETFGNKLAPIKTAMKDTFKEIFPKRINIGASLLSASDSIKKFANRIQISSDGLEDFKTIMKGLFSVISLGLKIIKTFISYIKNLDVNLDGITSKLRTVALAIANFFIKANQEFDESDPFKIIREGLEKLGDVLSKNNILSTLSKIKEGIKEEIHELMWISYYEGGQGLSGALEVMFDAFTDALRFFGDQLKNLTGIDITDFIDNLISSIQDLRNVVVDFVYNLNIADKLKAAGTAIKTFLEPLKELGGGILRTVKDAFKSLADMFDKSAFLSPSGAINLAAMVVLFEKLRKKISDTAYQADRIIAFFKGSGLKTLVGEGGFVYNLTNTMSALRTSILQFKNELKAKTILEVAGAIAILAASFYLLSMIDSDKIFQAGAAMAGLLAAVSAMMETLMAVDENKSLKAGWNVTQIGSSLIQLSVAVLILAAAMKTMDGLEWDDVFQGLMTIGFAMGAMLGVSLAVSKMGVNSFNKVATSMIIMSVAVKILASALTYFKDLEWDDVIQGMMAITGMMGELLGMALAVSKMGVKSFEETATGMLILAVGVKLLASSVRALGEMSVDQIVQGMITLTIILGELAGAVLILKNISGFNETAAGMLMIAVAVGIVGLAFKALADLDPAQIAMGFVAFAGTLGSIAAICTALGGELLTAGAGLIFVAIAMRILVGAIEGLGNLDVSVLVKGIIAMGAALAVLAGACYLMTGTIPGALAMLIVSVGLIALAEGLKILGDIGLGDMVKAIVGMAVALGILTVAAYAMSFALPGAAAMLVLSVSLIALAAGLAMLGAIDLPTLGRALIGLAASLSLFAGLSAILTPFLIPMTALAAIMLVVSAATAVFAASLALMSVALEALGVSGVIGATGLISFVQALIPWLDSLKDAAVVFLALGAALLVLDGAMILSAVSMTLMAASLILLASGLMAFSAAALVAATTMIIIKNLLIGGLEDIKEVLDAKKFKEIGENVMNALKDALKNGIKDAVAAVKDCGKQIINSFKEKLGIGGGSSKEANNIGGNFVQGFIEGIKKKISKAADACKDLGSKALSALRSKLKIASPSKETKKDGRFFDEGFATGITTNDKVVEDAAEDLGDTALNSMTSALQGLADMVDADFDDPTITPVLDLSNVQNGVNSIDSMLNRNQAANISANITASRKSQEQIDQYNSSQLQKLSDKLDAVVAASNNETNVDVNVVLEGDANGVFRLVRQQNNTHKKMTGKSAFA